MKKAANLIYELVLAIVCVALVWFFWFYYLGLQAYYESEFLIMPAYAERDAEKILSENFSRCYTDAKFTIRMAHHTRDQTTIEAMQFEKQRKLLLQAIWEQ